LSGVTRHAACVKSSNGPLIILLVLTTLGGAAWSWHEYQEIVVLRAAALTTSNSDAQALADYQKRLKILSDQIAALKGQARREEIGDASTVASDQPGPRRNGGFRAMMNNPQFQKLMSIQQKAMLDNTYAPLFKVLGLTPQQLDQFKNLMVQKQQAMMDARQAAIEQGINPRTDPDAFQQAVAQASAAVDSQIQAALGDAAYAQYEQYQQTLPQRNTTNQLQQSLSYTSSPLTDDQATQLIQILAQSAPAGGGNGGGGFGNMLGGGGPGGGGTGPITDQAITLAQGVLSAPQVQALQQLQQQQQVRQQMQQLMRASRQGGGG
jgi:hypothetical protein